VTRTSFASEYDLEKLQSWTPAPELDQDALVRKSRVGYAAGAVCSAAFISMLLSPSHQRLRSPGPANAGHAELACGECHREAKGTIRQQLQANARWVIGLRDQPADFGLMPVSSNDCIACHERPTDRHPIYRFLEPRFAGVREAIAPHRCDSCHREHSGRRVTIANGFCRHCHGGMKVDGDRTEPSHEAMAAQAEWSACLRCHDFHGNHEEEPPASLARSIGERELERYLDGGSSPWTSQKRYMAEKTRFQ
jgi:hypothetical protein